MMNVINEIETLRNKKTPDEIDQLLVNGELGEIHFWNGRPYIGNLALSYLIVEVHEPGFIENRPKGTVVHHIDGNPMNNAYVNLRVMSLSDHTSLHRTDPRFAEDIENIGKAISETKRKNWIDLSVFTKPFTVGDYAEASKIGFDTARYRLGMLVKEGELVCEKGLVNGTQCNVYRRELMEESIQSRNLPLYDQMDNIQFRLQYHYSQITMWT